MPYEIISQSDGTFKVCKKDKSKCFSKEGIPKERAIKQLKAIGMNENLTGGIVNKEKIKIAKKIKNYSLDKALEDWEKLKKVPLDKINLKSLIGNYFLDYFVFPYRLDTEGNKKINYYDYFKDKTITNKKTFKSLKKYYEKDVKMDKDKLLYKYFNLYYGSINQFKPIIAKYLYLKYKPHTVLDFSSGWGGRMLGALSIPDIKYIGFDTNKDLQKPYKEMIKTLEAEKRAKIYFQDSSKVDFSKYKYDFVFTSPPYYKTEVYEFMPEYESKEQWLNNFLFPVIKNSYNNLEKGGHYALNIPIDIYDDVIKILGEADDKIPLHINKRNFNSKEYKEFIYIWQKDKKLVGGAEGDIFDQKRYDSLVSYAETDKAREKYNKKRERFPKMDSYEDYLTKLKDISRQRSTTNKYELQRIEFEKQKTKQLNDMALENYKKHPEDIPMKCKLNENLEVVNDTTTAGECQRRHQLYQQKQKEADEKTPIGMIMKGLTTYGDIITSVVPMPAIVKDVYKLSKDITGQRSFLDGNGKPILEGSGAIPSLDILHKLTMQSYQPKAMNRIGQFNLISETPTLKFYKDDLSKTIIVSIRGTDDKEDLKADGLIAIGKLESSNRYLNDLQTLKYFQSKYPPSEFDYYGVAHSLGGAIADLFLKQGLLKAAVSYNPAVQPQDFNDTSSLNRRIYLESDPLYKIMGRNLTNKPEVRPARNTSMIEKAIDLIPSAPESSETPIWRKAIDLIPKASKAYNLYKSHQLTQFEGGGKSKFKKQLQKLNITQDEYLDYAKKIAKLRGYDDSKLELSNDGKHKLEYDGVPFGAVDYMDFILYLHLVKEGKIPYEEAIDKMTNYRKRAKKVMETTKSKVSPASLAYNITW